MSSEILSLLLQTAKFGPWHLCSVMMHVFMITTSSYFAKNIIILGKW